MQVAIEILRSIGVFTLGMVARFGVFLGMVALFVVPAVLIALAIRGREARRERALGVRDVDGVAFRPDLTYTAGHLWLHRRPGRGGLELGLDGLAQRLLPAVTAVDLAHAGTQVRRGDPIATLHGGGRALAIPAPFDGKIAGVNSAVIRDPALVKREGFGRGWLVVIAPEGDVESTLPSGTAAETWTRREAARWNRFLEERLGFAAADGGMLVAPAPWLVGEEGWRALVDSFLHT
jgi:glycine cleavage system H lipoate-binding protein